MNPTTSPVNVRIRPTLRTEVITNPLKCFAGVESHNIFCVLLCLGLIPDSDLSPVRFVDHFQAVADVIKKKQVLPYLHVVGPEDPRLKGLDQYFLRLEENPPRQYNRRLIILVAEFVANENQEFVDAVDSFFQ